VVDESLVIPTPPALRIHPEIVRAGRLSAGVADGAISGRGRSFRSRAGTDRSVTMRSRDDGGADLAARSGRPRGKHLAPGRGRHEAGVLAPAKEENEAIAIDVSTRAASEPLGRSRLDA